jgi:L-lactate dehydrogenase complex protein LldF
VAEWPLATTTLRQRTAAAVEDRVLGANVASAVDRFRERRAAALDALEDADGLRRAARAVRGEILADWAGVLGRFADAFAAAGGHVHWAATAEEANAQVLAIARRAGARTIAKSKSMVTEETGLNAALAAAGCTVTETDLGEWIIQLAGEHPSHIILPAVHRNRDQIAEVFADRAGREDPSSDPDALTAFARAQLRQLFLDADIGITGVNLGVAETGSIVLVTNEGNGRMITTLPRVQVALMGAERVVETWEQADLVLSLLARSATGQPLTSYTSVTTGPRREGEADGPDDLHLVILDAGRSDIAGTELSEMLNCIRCGACLNVCPVYRQTGGHAYGWVYPGPMGAVLTPLLAGGHELANASTLCGACMEACPVEIPLQDLLLALRRRKADDAGLAERSMWKAWAAAWSRPSAYRATSVLATRTRRLAPLLSRLPGATRWTAGRAMPVVAPRTFTERWKAGER